VEQVAEWQMMGDVLAVDAQDDVAEAVHLQEVAQLGVEEEASNGEMGVILQCDRARVNPERTRRVVRTRTREQGRRVP
jgi:hypothetical protein